jgi:toxin CcdB
MAQFDIYPGSGEGCDFLLDLQDNMLDELSTRVVAPLVAVDAVGPPMRILNPRVTIDDNPYILLTHLLAAISKSSLGKPVGSASSQRDEIVGSIDLIFTGI